MDTRVIPVLRIFDYPKTVEFYIDWLGFTVDWEHRFDEKAPLYVQVSKGPITLHLTEHHGDCCPGAKVYVETTGVRDYHRELLDKTTDIISQGLNRPRVCGYMILLVIPCYLRKRQKNKFPTPFVLGTTWMGIACLSI